MEAHQYRNAALIGSTHTWSLQKPRPGTLEELNLRQQQ